ncbi:MAG: heme ABC transporter ATP-binding protein [Sneathiella sp.]
MLKADNLNFSIGGKTILDRVSLEIKQGEIFAILGPNGAGKSTLMKCLSGYEKPTQGDISLMGQAFASFSLTDLAAIRAVLTQSVSINFPFTALEVAAMGRGQFSGFGQDARDFEIAREAMQLTEVSHLEKRLISTLSGGEQQRVHMARILAQLWDQTDCILFLDEPTSALDLKHQFMLFDICRTLTSQKNFAVVVILHDLQLAKRMTDQALLLDAGRTFAVGASADVINIDTVSTLYDIHKSQVML